MPPSFDSPDPAALAPGVARMLRLAQRRVPGLRLRDKAGSRRMRALALLLRPLVPDFQTGFITVLGRTIFLPRPLPTYPPRVGAALLGHELVHLLDIQRFGPLFYLSYVLPPAGRTLRAWWERRGYAVDLLLAHQEGEAALERQVAFVVELMSGPSYGYMWWGRAAARRFLEPTLAAVRDGTLIQQEPYRSIWQAWTGQIEGEHIR